MHKFYEKQELFDVIRSFKRPSIDSSVYTFLEIKSYTLSDANIERYFILAKKNNIKYQHEILAFGGTDTSSMQMAGNGCRAAALSIPSRYIHSGVEVIDMADAEACVDLTEKFIESIED